jgi:very-short-patch-repair endonuclease
MRQTVAKQQRAFARTLRAKATDAEIALWRLLRSRRLAGMKFRRQVPIGAWIVDFVSFEQRLIIEADGSQHAESDRDKRRDRDLSERGFRVLRFWNNDVLMKAQSVMESIAEFVVRSPSPGELRSPPSPTRGEGSSCAPIGSHPPSPTGGEGSKRTSE